MGHILSATIVLVFIAILKLATGKTWHEVKWFTLYLALFFFLFIPVLEMSKPYNFHTFYNVVYWVCCFVMGFLWNKVYKHIIS